MKIGILTFQYALNYGAVLQMYGLKDTLTKIGYEVEIINYVPKGFSYRNLKLNLRNSGLSKQNLININIYPKILRRFMIVMTNQNNLVVKFDDFLKENFKLSSSINNENWTNIKGKYDAIVVGSDQVWNPTNQKGKVYFLNSDLKCKKISYAADSTSNAVDIKHKEELKKALIDFQAISVRNIHTQEFVEQIIGKKVNIVPDPVILSNFDELLKKEETNSKYVLIYVLGKEIQGGHESVLKKIKEKYDKIKIIQVVMINQHDFTIIDMADEKIYDCSPTQWINLIYNAEIIYTDSFHATLFSIKFHKNFICYYSDSIRAPRLIALQNQYNLKSKIISSYEDMVNNDSLNIELDYDNFDKVFEEEKNKGINFLMKIRKDK